MKSMEGIGRALAIALDSLGAEVIAIGRRNLDTLQLEVKSVHNANYVLLYLFTMPSICR